MTLNIPTQSLAENAVENEISDEPALNWWVKETLRHIYRIISKVNSKHGIRVPETVKEAYDIDRQSGTDFWTKAITKETTNVRIEFEKLDRVTLDDIRKGNIKPGYEHINVHMIFDIKMDGKFTRKEILVADSHITAPPP